MRTHSQPTDLRDIPFELLVACVAALIWGA